MELYFKTKFIVEFVVPALIIGLIIIFIVMAYVKTSMKTKLMEKLGYQYERGLGTKVAYEFQPRWVKGNIKIHYREIDRLKYKQIKSFVESKENKQKN